jgi:hypothetical protein
MAGGTVRRGRSVWVALGVALWICGVAVGYSALVAYHNTPGDPGRFVERWPSGSRLARDAGRLTLVMAVHPLCPCTAASVAELARVVEAGGDRQTTYVLTSGAGRPTDRQDVPGSLRSLAETSGVVIVDDPDGAEAAGFGARTSGHVALYDRGGRLVFRGGITRSRGQAGDNPGRGAVTGLVDGRGAARATSPVFGCPIFDPAPAGSPRPRR